MNLSKKMFFLFVFAIAIILSLDILGINVMPFVAGAGVAGTYRAGDEREPPLGTPGC